jgi:hypothetical protein
VSCPPNDTGRGVGEGGSDSLDVAQLCTFMFRSRRVATAPLISLNINFSTFFEAHPVLTRYISNFNIPVFHPQLERTLSY